MNNEELILKELQYSNRKKSLVISFLLTLFFGPFGILYSSLHTCVVNLAVIVIAIVVICTLPVGVLNAATALFWLFISSYIWSIALGLMDTDDYNSQLRKSIFKT